MIFQVDRDTKNEILRFCLAISDFSVVRVLLRVFNRAQIIEASEL